MPRFCHEDIILSMAGFYLALPLRFPVFTSFPSPSISLSSTTLLSTTPLDTLINEQNDDLSVNGNLRTRYNEIIYK